MAAVLGVKAQSLPQDSEMRTGRLKNGMAVQRLMEQSMPVIYKGTKYEDCLPIGSMDIVDNFPYQDLRDYYQTRLLPRDGQRLDDCQHTEGC